MDYSENEEPGKRWCICQSTDTSRFMIGCDRCHEWFHGDCVNITKKKADEIKKYFCVLCQSKHPSLKIVLKKKHASNSREACGGCKGCVFRGVCEASKQSFVPSDADTLSSRSSDTSSKNEKRNNLGKKRQRIARDLTDDEASSGEEWGAPSRLTNESDKRKPTSAASKSLSSGGTPSSQRRASSKQVSSKTASREPKEDTTPSNHAGPFELPVPSVLSQPRQCLGPGCVNAVYAPDSKYCSKDCGLKLALKRLEVILPQSLNRSADPDKNISNLDESYSEMWDKKRLEAVIQAKYRVNDKLVELEEQHRKLTEQIQLARSFKPSEHEMEASLKCDTAEADQMEQQVCVVCGTEINMRHALRHMERCFQKMEGSTVFCASQKEQIIGTPLFCDTFDPQAKAYCKRLRVVCEHFKDVKLPAETPCGFPLTEAVFEATGQFCCTPRHKCTRHFGWERRKRACIDLERYRNLIRVDELLQEEQRIKRRESQRRGLLNLLLFRTIDHAPDRVIPPPPLPS